MRARGERTRVGLGFVAAVLALMAGPARADDAESRAVASYSRYELREIRAKVDVPPKVVDKLTRELKLKLDEPLARWNAEGAQPGRAGTLAIEVEILEMKFVGGAKRAFARAMAGNSSCVAAVKLVDTGTDAVLERKVFGEMAGGQRGALTMGASDNHMLDRLAAAMGAWVMGQYSAAPVADVEATSDAAPASN